jgi:predicted molibdopterin-dependent oxidoreductase YjgC
MAPPGDAMEDWQILVNAGLALGVKFEYTSAAQIRGDIAARFPNTPELRGLTMLAFSRPMEAQTWLQASNPSERWKWDFMYQDLPPVKGELDPSALPLPPGAIPLKSVK